MDFPEMQQVLSELSSRGTDATQVHTFCVWINDREVRVELFERGNQSAGDRFYAHAYWADLPEEEREANKEGYTIGNPGPDVKDALFNLHWDVFRN